MTWTRSRSPPSRLLRRRPSLVPRPPHSSRRRRRHRRRWGSSSPAWGWEVAGTWADWPARTSIARRLQPRQGRATGHGVRT